VPSATPSPEPSNLPSSQASLCAPSQSVFEETHNSPRQSPVELDESGSNGKQVDDTASVNDQLDGPQDDDMISSEGEEEDTDLLLDAVGAEPKVKDNVRSWEELHEQIKDDLWQGHREHTPHSHMNKLMVLRNFTTLHIKGRACITTSEEVAWQFHEGAGVHFTCKIRFIARHYQLFEQLPDEERGGDRGQSLLNNE
jgi:hypothetical protein